MKQVYTILVAFLLTLCVSAQTPEKMSYQAVIRNSTNSLITNSQIGMEVNIRMGSPTGMVVYTETMTPVTNANGLISVEIGGESGFGSIDWANDLYFLETNIAVEPPLTNYTITAVSQLLSVPYALHAKSAETVTGEITETDPLWMASPSSGITGTNISDWNTAFSWGDHAAAGYDGDVTNELQTLSISNDTLFLTNGNFVKLPAWSPASLLPPTVTNAEATDLGCSNATLHALVNPNGLMTTVEFEFETPGINSSPSSFTITGTEDVMISTAVTGLEGNRTYHYRVKSTNAVNTTYGEDTTFTTQTTPPEVRTISVFNISGTTAHCNMEVVHVCGAPVLQAGVCWSTSPSPTLDDNFTINHSHSMTGLSFGTTYYVRAYATNSIGTAYGNELTFTTLALPTLTTTGVSKIQGTSAYATAQIINDGGSSILMQGFCWSTSPEPTLDDHVSATFMLPMTGLTPETIYYIRAYATNHAGTGYGNELSFNSGYTLGFSTAGGSVIYNDGTGHGIVVATTDQPGAIWGCMGTIIGTHNHVTSGLDNTNLILAGCPTPGIAARVCDDLVLNGYDDWYLPSKDELSLIVDNILHLSVGLSGIYLSSSEWNDPAHPNSEDENAWIFNFHGLNSSSGSSSKDALHKVRAVRNF